MTEIDRRWNDRLFYRSRVIEASKSLRKAMIKRMSDQVIKTRRSTLEVYKMLLKSTLNLQAMK